MAVAKEQIRQIISENNSNSVADIYTLLKESFKDILQELILDHIKIQQIFLSHLKNTLSKKVWLKSGAYLVIEKSISMVKNRNKESDEENNYVSLEGSTKNQKARTIELNKEAKYILQKIKYSRDSSLPDEFIVTTKTGKINTASNLEHRMKVIMKNAELQGVKGGLHIFRKTFATRMYESGARVEEIAAYIGDLESTTQKYYIAIRKKVVSNGEVRQVVKLPGIKEETTVA